MFKGRSFHEKYQQEGLWNTCDVVVIPGTLPITEKGNGSFVSGMRYKQGTDYKWSALKPGDNASAVKTRYCCWRQRIRPRYSCLDC